MKLPIIKAKTINKSLYVEGILLVKYSERTTLNRVLKEELFKFGMSLEENELIEKMTGKKLSIEDFINNLK